MKNFQFPIYNLQKNKNKNKKQSDKKTFRTAFIIVLFFILSISGTPFGTIQTAKADELSDLNNQLNELNQQINQINNDLAVKRQEKKTLQNEIAIFDSQIYQIQLQINRTDAEISKLQKEIEGTLAKIKEAEDNLAKQKEVLNENLRILYKDGQTSSIEIVAGSDNFSEFMNQTEYLKSIQDKVSETIDKIKALKVELDLKKKELETKKTEQLTLKNQQVGQRNQLNGQRIAKDNLLSATKGQENLYQNTLSNIQKEVAKIQSAIWNLTNTGEYVSLGHVERGSIVGYIGNSGYSTGCHLHFEIRSSLDTHVNPANYIGNGYFGHPVPSVPANVPYGYSDAYFPGVFHTGIDYADGCAGTAIKSTAPGEIIRRVSGRPNTFPYSYEYGNYVIVSHENGYFSLYAHLQ